MVTKFLKCKMIFVVLILLCGCTKTANKDSANKKMHSFDLIMQQVDDSMAVNPNYALRLINNNIPNVNDNVVYCKFISMRAWNYVRKSQNDSANKCIGIILNYAWKMKVIFYRPMIIICCRLSVIQRLII